MENPPVMKKDRTWVTAGVLLVIAFWTMAIFSAREYALWKSSYRNYFFSNDETVDYNIAILKDPRLLRDYCLYSTVLIAFIPIALQKLSSRLWIGVATVILFFAPCVWYGLRIGHVANKLVDWGAVFDDAPPKEKADHAKP